MAEIEKVEARATAAAAREKSHPNVGTLAMKGTDGGGGVPLDNAAMVHTSVSGNSEVDASLPGIAATIRDNVPATVPGSVLDAVEEGRPSEVGHTTGDDGGVGGEERQDEVLCSSPNVGSTCSSYEDDHFDREDDDADADDLVNGSAQIETTDKDSDGDSGSGDNDDENDGTVIPAISPFSAAAAAAALEETDEAQNGQGCGDDGDSNAAAAPDDDGNDMAKRHSGESAEGGAIARSSTDDKEDGRGCKEAFAALSATGPSGECARKAIEVLLFPQAVGSPGPSEMDIQV